MGCGYKLLLSWHCTCRVVQVVVLPQLPHTGKDALMHMAGLWRCTWCDLREGWVDAAGLSLISFVQLWLGGHDNQTGSSALYWYGRVVAAADPELGPAGNF